MFIIWGTKVVKTRLGRVADFCPICRDFEPFKVERIETVGHLYYIPLGRRQTVGLVKKCENCAILLKTEDHEHDSYSRDRTADVDTLIPTTNPRLPEKKQARLDMENRLRQKKLTNDERQALLLEPFYLLNSWAVDNGRAMEKDVATIVSCLSLVAVPVLILSFGGSTRLMSEDSVLMTALAAGAGLLLLTIYMAATIGRRYGRRVLVPRLAQTLRPLQPSREELEGVLGYLKEKKLPIAKLVKLDILDEALQVPVIG